MELRFNLKFLRRSTKMAGTPQIILVSPTKLRTPWRRLNRRSTKRMQLRERRERRNKRRSNSKPYLFRARTQAIKVNFAEKTPIIS